MSTFVERPARYAFAAMLLFVLTCQWDAFAVNLVLPRVGAEFGADASGLEWVIAAGAFASAAVKLIAGRAGDRFGLRPMVVAGYTGFALASAACALAQDVTSLVVARTAQGLTGAMVMTGGLALLATSYPPEKRGRVIALAFGFGGVTTVAGPVLGGVLADRSDWRLVFWIEVPVSLLGAFLASRTSNARAEKERRASTEPVHRNRGLLRVIASGSLGNASIVLVLFAVPWLLHERGVPTAVAGALMSFPAAALAIGVGTADRFLRFGVRSVLATSLVAAGIALLASMIGPLAVFVAFVTVAAGAFGIVNGLTIVAAMTTVPAERAGEAAGLTKTAITIAGALGLALAGNAGAAGAFAVAAVLALVAVLPLAVRPKAPTRT